MIWLPTQNAFGMYLKLRSRFDHLARTRRFFVRGNLNCFRSQALALTMIGSPGIILSILLASKTSLHTGSNIHGSLRLAAESAMARGASDVSPTRNKCPW
jgi:hypothetical protein